MTSELDYATAYLETRFPTNPRERLELREESLEPVPFFVLARTRLGCIWRFREDLLGATIRELSKLAGREPPLQSPLEDAPPPEREEPMARVLREAGMTFLVVRDLLVHRAGWAPTSAPAATILFRVGEAGDASGLAETVERTHMGSSIWQQRDAFAQLDAREWIRFADLICFIPDAPASDSAD